MRAVGENTATVKRRVPYVLDLVGLKDKMKCKPSELSGGEQQRVSLARALVNNPEIIVADEPTGNIDPELSHEIIELLTRINAMGTTVLVVTHEHELVREFNQRVITIDKGEVISDTATMPFVYEEPEDADDDTMIDIAAPVPLPEAEEATEPEPEEPPVAEPSVPEEVIAVAEEQPDTPAEPEPAEELTDSVAATPEEIAEIEALAAAAAEPSPAEEADAELQSVEEPIADDNFEDISYEGAYIAPDGFETEALTGGRDDAEPQAAATNRE